jgi:hypothetical protein
MADEIGGDLRYWKRRSGTRFRRGGGGGQAVLEFYKEDVTRGCSTMV